MIPFFSIEVSRKQVAAARSPREEKTPRHTRRCSHADANLRTAYRASCTGNEYHFAYVFAVAPVSLLETQPWTTNTTSYIRSEFEKHRSLPRTDVTRIEHFLRKGEKRNMRQELPTVIPPHLARARCTTVGH